MCERNVKKVCTSDEPDAKMDNAGENTVYNFFAYFAGRYVFPPERARSLLLRILSGLGQAATEEGAETENKDKTKSL